MPSSTSTPVWAIGACLGALVGTCSLFFSLGQIAQIGFFSLLGAFVAAFAHGVINGSLNLGAAWAALRAGRPQDQSPR